MQRYFCNVPGECESPASTNSATEAPGSAPEKARASALFGSGRCVSARRKGSVAWAQGQFL